MRITSATASLARITEETFDIVVVGAGALGAATAYWLSRAPGSPRVVVCEQWTPGHCWGSSDDHSRIIRHSYHSRDYTALTPAMFDAWAEVEQHAGMRLVVSTGGLDLALEASPGADVLRAYQIAMDAHTIPYELIDADELRARWPQWQVPDDTVALYQAQAGLVDIRKATATLLRLACEAGVEVRSGCAVKLIRDSAGGCEVQTSTGTISCARVVLCAGSWAGPLLDALGCDLPLALSQEQVQYFAPADLEMFAPERFPVWIWHAEQEYYGVPVYGEQGIKAARDLTGRFVTQETRRYEPEQAEVDRIASFLREHLPAAAGRLLSAKTCVYDLPRDRELVIGPLPDHPNVHIAVGAGHAGKFASLIGRILTDLVTTASTAYPVVSFSASRPGVGSDAPARYRLDGRDAGPSFDEPAAGASSRHQAAGVLDQPATGGPRID